MAGIAGVQQTCGAARLCHAGLFLSAHALLSAP
jgi:hypothetical protein